jgi:hypothetical protein
MLAARDASACNALPKYAALHLQATVAISWATLHRKSLAKRLKVTASSPTQCVGPMGLMDINKMLESTAKPQEQPASCWNQSHGAASWLSCMNDSATP